MYKIIYVKNLYIFYYKVRNFVILYGFQMPGKYEVHKLMEKWWYFMKKASCQDVQHIVFVFENRQ